MARTKGQSGGDPSIPQAARLAYDKIVSLTDSFCREHLNDEYLALCRKLAGVLARKRPSPLLRGKVDSWACGIVRVIAWANYLGDPNQPHHLKMIDIDEVFRVSESTGAAKSKAIRDLLKMLPVDPEWTLPSRIDQIPIFRML
jgi:Domain of unknown function (DUF6398)